MDQLEELYASGFIQQEEYEERKAALLASGGGGASTSTSRPRRGSIPSLTEQISTVQISEEAPQPTTPTLSPRASSPIISSRNSDSSSSDREESPPPVARRASPVMDKRTEEPKRTTPPPQRRRSVSPPRVPSAAVAKPSIPKNIGEFSRFAMYVSLVALPPPQFWKPIVDIKKNHMNPRIKRPPYPHMTLLQPFVEPDRFDDAVVVLREALRSVNPFQIRIARFEIYNNDSSFTLFLNPETTPPNSLQRLFETCRPVFPNLEPKSFDPHIGVGYFKSKAQTEELQRKYQSAWKTIDFTVKEIYIMSRVSETDPFEVRRVIPIGPTESAPHFKNVPLY
ncbi:Endonuclease/exonuclease/phosphatase family protein [Pelomyxa schiedti]|nr:Endonuclease/exonuclease/phosphatase family protein [Pelomyxa schiedti]